MLEKLWSWSAVGGVVLCIVSGGFSFMTSSHPLIADGSYIAAAVLFLSKFVTWEETRQQDDGARLKVVVGGVGITLAVLSASIFGNHRLNASKQVKPYADPSTFVEFVRAYPSGGFPLFRAGHQVILNIFILNQGPLLAHDVRWDAFVSLLQTPVLASVENELYEQFRAQSRKSSEELGPLDGKWGTFYTRTISERDVLDLSGAGTRLLLYMGGYINYRDSTGVHEYQFCLYLQPLT